MRTRIKATAVATTLAGVWSCVLPTEGCGCTIPQGSVMVVGTLQDSLGAPMPRTTFTLRATTDQAFVTVVTSTAARTDDAGAFSTRAYSTYGPGAHTVAAIVPRVGRDSAVLTAGSAAFKLEKKAPDTIRVSLRLP